MACNIGTEILVIGGGVTGAGVAYDAAMRGFKTILVEKGDLTHGTTGRYHGLLHSGGRYAVKDPQAAHECIVENRILKRIMPEAIEDTGGFFILLPTDNEVYADRWAVACAAADIDVEELTPEEALAQEPLLNPKIRRAFRVPDAACDSFDALHALARAIRTYGGQVWPRRRVEALISGGGRVCGATVRDLVSDQIIHLAADLVINAAGPWADQIAAMAGCNLDIEHSKGTLIAYASRVVNTIINRCAMPGDGDILVPVGTVSVIGTTSVHVDDPDRYAIEHWEVEQLRLRGAELVPALAHARSLRAWAGVRPLIKSLAVTDDGRAQSRTHTVINHTEVDGVAGFISIVGGKFTTFRLMAEDAVNLACVKLGTARPCRTAEESLPGSEAQHYFALGERLERLDKGDLPGELVCECEIVSRAQLKAAIEENGSHILSDLRRDLRLGMGPCQGAFCAWRAAGVLREVAELPSEDANAALVDFMQARWKGVCPVADNQTARQVALNLRLYRGLLGVDKLPRSGQTEPYPTEKTS